MATDTGKTAAGDRPYRSSWVDRLNAWVAALPFSAATFYVGTGALLALVQLLVLWLDGGLQANAIVPVIIYNGMATPYLLALIHLTDGQAVAAMTTAKAGFAASAQEFSAYTYRLATMPFPSSLITGTIATLGVILTEQLSDVPASYAALEQFPAFAVVFQIVDKSSAFLFGVFIYHTIRQLRLVNRLNTEYVQISLFRSRPIQSFSRLTASTAVGLIAFVYLWMFINPEILHDPLILGYAVALTGLAVLVFAWPLLGVHRLLVRAKDETLRDLDLEIEAVFTALRQPSGEGGEVDVDRLYTRLSGLEAQHDIVDRIPTWPWRPETGRLVLTAVAIPLALMVLQYLIDQALR